MFRFMWSAAIFVAASICIIPALKAQVSLPISGKVLSENPVERVLASRVSLDLIEPTIQEFAGFLRDQFKINVMIDFISNLGA